MVSRLDVSLGERLKSLSVKSRLRDCKSMNFIEDKVNIDKLLHFDLTIINEDGHTYKYSLSREPEI